MATEPLLPTTDRKSEKNDQAAGDDTLCDSINRARSWLYTRLCSFVKCLNRNEETNSLLPRSSSEEPEQSTRRLFKESEPLPACLCREESEQSTPRSFEEESEPLLQHPLYNKLERNEKAESHLTHSEPRDQSKSYLTRSEGPAEPHLTHSEQSEPVLCSNCNRNLGLTKSQLKSPKTALTIRCQK